MEIRDKTTTNKWTYERSHKSLNSYSLVEYNKIYPNTNSWKVLQKKSLWQVDFDNLYFWNTLNKTHQGIFVWNRNNRLHTSNKKHVHKERKGTTHVRVGERNIVEYNKIYHNTNSWKVLQEKSLWQVDFDNLYFWNILNKTHQGIFMWNRNNRLHTSNKKHVYKGRKETTHERVDERKKNIHQHKRKR